MPPTTPVHPGSTPADAGGLGARLAAASREDAVRARFVREVLSRVPLARVVEAHLFAPMRQGGVESGIAVLAARIDDAALPIAASAAESGAVESEVASSGAPEEHPVPDEPSPLGASLASAPPSDAPPRLTVYTASYRLTVRGPDRGRWQVDIREEADAPLVTVDAVVRGVQRRAGDESAATRLDATELARVAKARTTPVAAGGPGL